MSQPLFSIILPFYKQADHIPAVLAEFEAVLRAHADDVELLLVVNGVEGANVDAEERVRSEHPRIVEYRLKRSGWGLAVLHGLRNARGRFVCYTNTARTRIDELMRILEYAKISEDVVIKATRISRGSWMRKWVSNFYNLENRIVLKTPIWDVNATPKVIPRKILDRLTLTSEGDLIDAELLVKCFRLGVPIIEIPIQHMDRRSGKSTTGITSAFKMFIGLLKLRKG
jgi:glycosyltransferase involved in cell wall biosynthesis